MSCEYELEPPHEGWVLTADAQEEHDDWDAQYADESCFCSACGNPPCSYCEGGGTHPGHPLALNDDPDAWESPEDFDAGVAKDAYDRAMGIME